MRAVVGEHGMRFVGNGFEEASEEIAGDAACSFLMQFDKGEFAGAIDGDESLPCSVRNSAMRRKAIAIASSSSA